VQLFTASLGLHFQYHLLADVRVLAKEVKAAEEVLEFDVQMTAHRDKFL